MLEDIINGSKLESVEALEIRRLIESGEARDVEDAKDTLREGRETIFYRGVERDVALQEIIGSLDSLDKIYRDLQNKKEGVEPLSENEKFDRYELRFAMAIVKIAANADEREYLYCKYLFPPTQPVDDKTEQKRRESLIRRLEKRMDTVVTRMGMDREREIINQYHKLLQELFSDF